MLIETSRLILFPTPLDVIWTRLAQSDDGEGFEADLDIAETSVRVTFPPAWPGGALGFFPNVAAQLEADPTFERWEGTLLERATFTAIGQMGCKGLPDARGEVEVGYGLSPEARGKGYATEMLTALCTWLLKQETVSRVTALTLPDNWASMRVLEKSGFRRVGQEVYDEGRFLLWARSR